LWRRLLQQPDQRGEREHEESRDENILLEQTGMHDEERRHRAGRRRCQGRQVGEHEPRKVEGGEHHDPAGQSAKHADEMGQGWLIGRLHHEGRALRQIDHEQGMVVGVASLADADKLDEFVPRHAERVVDQAERHHHRDRREQKGGDGRPGHGRTRDGRPRQARPHVYPPLRSAAPARTGF
jgi:hypothetical protein